ncbi:hypothetical protein LWI29_014663 [Acer saccharum]|uniref:Ubiquitin-like domain-containing protein n=1 Tax=Acer saccharum TaxID=4024 RepID=A0AA39VKS8_ACESA|nr:hypothetical protein LWI29_014663 [Acer saccharum]KAK1568965.1 hypothetical protein Q3G72_031019 [Acer saccharum]
MKVAVEILTGPLFYIEVGDDATVGDLKKQIASQQELPCDRLILTLDLENDQDHTIIKDDQDEDSLVDCGIKDGSKIFLSFTPIDDESTHQFVESTLPDSSID